MFRYFTMHEGKLIATVRARLVENVGASIRHNTFPNCDGLIVSGSRIAPFIYVDNIAPTKIIDNFVKYDATKIVKRNFECCMELIEISNSYEICLFDEDYKYNGYSISGGKFIENDYWRNPHIGSKKQLYLSDYYYVNHDGLYSIYDVSAVLIISKGGFVILENGQMMEMPCKINNPGKIRFLVEKIKPIYVRRSYSR